MINYFIELVNSPVGLIGLLASIVVLVSMCFNTLSVRGERLMRASNLLGSVLSVIYGLMLGADGFGMLILNVPLVFVNLYYLFKKRGNQHVPQ